MRPSVLSFLLPLLLGCSGQNVVAGEEKTKAEQLEASLPAWCDSACSRLNDCNSGAPCDCSGDVCDCSKVSADCPTSCGTYFKPFTTGEACAAIGQRIVQCIDRATCDELGGRSDPCPLTAAERAACPAVDVDGSTDPPMSVGSSTGYAGSANLGDDGGPSYGGAISYAGSASLPNGASSGSSSGGSGSTSGPVVNCSDSHGAGGGQPQAGSASQVICEEGREGCSDGHTYSWVCATDSQGHRACSCFVDQNVTGAFAPGAACPLVKQVNTGCGWNLNP
jgi:hypothetical protein